MKNAYLRKINISSTELNSLKLIGKGGFAIVFKTEDSQSVIKKYHEQVKTGNDFHCNNPCLKPDKIKFRRLNKRNNNIKYTDVDLELVYCNGKFVAVKKKYYEGKSLCKIFGTPLKLKKQILFELVRNSLELTDNKIYTFDPHLDNIIFTINNEVKIIDLDDDYSRVTLFSNPRYRKKFARELENTILQFIYYNLLDIPGPFIKKITNKPIEVEKRSNEDSFDRLLRLIDSIEMDGNVIIVKLNDLQNMNLEVLKRYIDDNELSLVIAYDKRKKGYDEQLDIINNKLNDIGIEVYDIFTYEKDYKTKVNNYIISHDCCNVHFYQEDFYVYEKK